MRSRGWALTDLRVSSTVLFNLPNTATLLYSADPNTKLFLLLLHNSNFAIAVNQCKSLCFLMVLDESCERVV